MNQTPAIAQLRLSALNTAAKMRSAAAVKYMMGIRDKHMHYKRNYILSISIAVSA